MSITDIQKEELAELIKQKSRDNMISCAQARALAEELNLPYQIVGDMANDLKIKVRYCQLGCF